MSPSRPIALGSLVLITAGLAYAVPGLITARWIGPSGGLWSTPGNWDIGVVPNGLDDTAIVDDNGKADVDARMDINVNLLALDVNAGDSVTIENNADLTMRGAVTNDGLITVESTGNSTNFVVGVDEVDLLGTGTLRLTGDVPVVTATVFNFDLDNNPDHEIRGVGNVGANTADLINQGLISADVAAGAVVRGVPAR